MKKRKGNLLQRMTALLLSAALTVGMAENMVSFQVMAAQTTAADGGSREAQETPNAQIDYASGKLTGLTANAEYQITVDGNAETVTADDAGAILLEDYSGDVYKGYYGYAISIVRKGNGTASDSSAQSLSIAAKGKAPAKTEFRIVIPAINKSVTLGGAEVDVPMPDTAAISRVYSNIYEYSMDGGKTWTPGSGEGDEKVPGGKSILIRKLGTNGDNSTLATPPSEALAITIKKEETPDAKVDYKDRRLTNLLVGELYKITAEDGTVLVEKGMPDADGKFRILDAYYGQTISLEKRGTDIDTDKDSTVEGSTISDKQEITLKPQPEAPSQSGIAMEISGAETIIKGIPADCEYSTSTSEDDWDSWKSGGEDVRTKHQIKVRIRKKSTENTPPSKSFSITTGKEATPEAKVVMRPGS